jgi:3-oxoacyl-[acyl-carrier-protein] synthase-3
MPAVTTRNAAIVGVACTLPRKRVTTDDLAARVGGVDPKKIVAMTGIRERRVAAPEICASDLCEDAARRLISGLGWEPDSIGALVFVSQSPDYFLPATACLLQQKLGLAKHCAAFDVNQGCSGYVYGLWLAASLIEAGLERVLLLVGDTSTRRVSEQDRSAVFLFGDTGSATALERRPCDLHFVLGTDGAGGPNLIVPAGQCRALSSPETLQPREAEGGNIRTAEQLYMNGAEVMAFTLREVPKLWEEVLALSGLDPATVDSVVMHQANRFIIETIAKRLKVPLEKVPLSIPELGNTSCASVAITLTACLRDQLASSTMRLAMLGFGVGWSWGACIGNVGPICIPDFAEIGD